LTELPYAPMQKKSLGQVAYEAYFEQSKGKSLISGAPLPEFGAQRQDVQAAWEAAADAVTAALIGDGKLPSARVG